MAFRGRRSACLTIISDPSLFYPPEVFLTPDEEGAVGGDYGGEHSFAHLVLGEGAKTFGGGEEHLWRIEK